MNKDGLQRWVLTSAFLLLFLLMESALFPWLIPDTWRNELSVYPKLLIVGLIYISIMSTRRVGVFYALAFGLLQDVLFYGHMIGIHAFSYALATYLSGLLMRPNRIGVYSAMAVHLLSLLAYELTIYGLYRLFGVTAVHFRWLFMNGMLPSVLISLFLALLLYIPVRKWLEPSRTERNNEENV